MDQRTRLIAGGSNVSARCYLTDEWGCPDMQPVLGIPFYLADPNLGKLERAIDDLEDSREIMRYMRHEAGHVFNYAIGYTAPQWREPSARSFGRARRYRPVLSAKASGTSKAGHAQKHRTRTLRKRSPSG
jgi:hypothetical protein